MTFRVNALGAALGALALASVTIAFTMPAAANPSQWQREWPRTDFDKHSVALDSILSGGVRKDQIPAIDKALYAPVEQVRRQGLADNEPVVSIDIDGDRRAYPLRILIWHEIVNDVVNGVPVAVTYCPLCNSAVVFDRRVDGTTLDFGTTGKLRHSDLVMYDRQTESWWQQFLGEAIVGEMTGALLTLLPMRMESIARFAERAPDGQVLIPTNPEMRRYGRNPYREYDSLRVPFLYRGDLPSNVPPLERVVVVGKEAWAFSLLREVGKVEAGDLVITWEPGQASALDSAVIADGRDVGNVVVQRRTAAGLEDALHDVSFAFAFHAFHPDGVIHAAE